MMAPAADHQAHLFLAEQIKARRHWLRLSTAGSLVAAFASIGFAALVAWIVETVLIGGQTGIPWQLLGLACLLALLRLGAHSLRDVAGLKLSASVRKAVRSALLERVSESGPLWVSAHGATGAWASRYQDQVDALHGYYARYLAARSAALWVPGLLWLAVLWQDWLAALLLLLSAPLIPLFAALIGMGSGEVHARQQVEQQRLAGHFLDRLRNLDLLRRNQALERASIDVTWAAERFRVLTMRVLRVAFLSSAVIEFFSAVAIGLIAIYVGFGLLGSIEFGPAGGLGLFSGLFVLLLAVEFFVPLRNLAASHHDRASALAAAAELAVLLAPPRQRWEPAAASCLLDGEFVFRLQQVGVTYQAQRPAAVDDLNLDVKRGELLGIAGESGSGKSTLLALLAGFIQPDRGVLQRGGDAGFAWIGQRTHLFHGTLRDNLRIACKAPLDDAALCKALSAAGLAIDDPRLSDGLDSVIGEANRGLSGGQAQRVALARALLCGHHIWLLDEPTSAVDADTASTLGQRIFELAREAGVTVVLASHDKQLLKLCQRVVYLHQGQPVPTPPEPGQ